MDREQIGLNDLIDADLLRAELAAARSQIEHLKTALATNRHIAVAVGILMRDRLCTEDEAFAILSKLSQCQNRKLRDVAEDVVERGTLA